ncbi:MAG TPA: mechanosensitive ion channel domain-containing protein [Sphingomonas sp.]|jgi:small-conductance mechanosensitive channel|uniref:mechanosensitive ion channel family protein n=1 Tax=Sphingomonas sp. TaxID=28214 RepID=UPI002ED9E0BC
MSTPKPKALDARAGYAETRDFFVQIGAWVEGHWLQLLIATGFGLLIVLALQAVRGLGKRLCAREDSLRGWGRIGGRVLARTNNFFIVMVAVRLVTRYGGAPPQVAELVGFLFTVAVVFQGAIWARELILGAVERRTESEHHGEAIGSAMGLIRLLVTVVLFAIALIVVLDNVGVNVTGLVAGLGVGGIAIGLAAQGIFGDLFAALAIIFDRPFRRGDAIAYDQTVGTVEEIGLKSTRVRGVDGELRVIANKVLLDKELRNNTRRERHHVKWVLGLAYETPVELLERVPTILREIVEGAGDTFNRAGLVGFGASALNFELEFDSGSSDFQAHYDTRHRIGLAILRRFAEEGIALPYPIQEVRFDAARGSPFQPESAPATTDAN